MLASPGQRHKEDVSEMDWKGTTAEANPVPGGKRAGPLEPNHQFLPSAVETDLEEESLQETSKESPAIQAEGGHDVMRIVLKVTSSNEHCNGGCEFALLDLTPELARWPCEGSLTQRTEGTSTRISGG